MLTMTARRYQLSKPYFRDWTNMKYHKGKTFLANPKIFRSEVSLYFPNLFGRTLSTTEGMDTTPILKGKISIVSVFSSVWADEQAKTFTSMDQNLALREVVEQSGGRAQMVHVNLEDRTGRWLILWATLSNLKKSVPTEEHSRYFIVKNTLTDAFREVIGWANKYVGYVYLVDQNCKIRWIGSGHATSEEKDSLVKGVRRLLDERSERLKARAPAPTAEPTTNVRTAEATAVA